jgi:hypothetical protein
MMSSFLFSFIASCITFVQNPVLWFSKKHWFIKFFTPLLIFPIISALSIFVYQQKTTLHQNTSLETKQIKDQITSLETSMEEQHKKLEYIIDAKNLTAISNSTNSSAQHTTSEIQATSKVGYIPLETASVAAYVTTNSESKITTHIPGGALLFISDKKNDWTEVNYKDDLVWIKNELLIELIWPK